jgi:Gram-negative bacterial TonB protein C-terminal
MNSASVHVRSSATFAAMTRSKLATSSLAGALIAWLAGAQPARSLPVTTGSHPDPALVENWKSEIERARDEADRGNFENARRAIDRVLKEMIRRIERGPGAGPLLANAVYVRALVAAGFERERDALWDFDMAAALEPTFRKYNAAVDGPAGTRLAALLATRHAPEQVPRPEVEKAGPGSGDAGAASLTPPKKLHVSRPRFPRAKAAACIEGPVSTLMVIDEKGLPKEPFVVSTADPIFVYQALESLRDWRFEPAREYGRPVSFFYRVTVNFDLPYCH